MSQATHSVIWVDGWRRTDDDARRLSRRRNSLVVQVQLSSSEDLIWLRAFDQGNPVRSILYTAEQGWSQEGRPLRTERTREVRRLLASRRVLAVPHGYRLLDAVLGASFDDLPPDDVGEAVAGQGSLGDALERLHALLKGQHVEQYGLVEGRAGRWFLAGDTKRARASIATQLALKVPLFRYSTAARELISLDAGRWPRVPVRTKADMSGLVVDLTLRLGSRWSMRSLVWSSTTRDLRALTRTVVNQLSTTQRFELLERLSARALPGWVPLAELGFALAPLLEKPDPLLRWVSRHPRAAHVFVRDRPLFQQTFMGFAKRLDTICEAMVRAPDEDVIAALEGVHRVAIRRGRRVVAFESTR